MLTGFIKVPLPSPPKYTVSPGGCATLLAGVIVFRKQVVFVGGCKIELPFNETPKHLDWEQKNGLETNKNRIILHIIFHHAPVRRSSAPPVDLRRSVRPSSAV